MSCCISCLLPQQYCERIAPKCNGMHWYVYIDKHVMFLWVDEVVWLIWARLCAHLNLWSAGRSAGAFMSMMTLIETVTSLPPVDHPNIAHMASKSFKKRGNSQGLLNHGYGTGRPLLLPPIG